MQGETESEVAGEQVRDRWELPAIPHSTLCVLNSTGRFAAWSGLIVLLAAYAHLAFRPDSSFFTVSWMPHNVAWWILKYTLYRNFWGFGLLGFYCAFALGTWWWVRRGGRWQWGAAVLWVLPVAKEAAQTILQTRHGTLAGALYGLGGAMLGLALGCGLRASAQWIFCRKQAAARAIPQ
jgi:hypothetical protein